MQFALTLAAADSRDTFLASLTDSIRINAGFEHGIAHLDVELETTVTENVFGNSRSATTTIRAMQVMGMTIVEAHSTDSRVTPDHLIAAVQMVTEILEIIVAFAQAAEMMESLYAPYADFGQGFERDPFASGYDFEDIYGAQGGYPHHTGFEDFGFTPVSLDGVREILSAPRQLTAGPSPYPFIEGLSVEQLLGSELGRLVRRS